MKRLIIEMDPSLHIRLKIAAAASGTTMTQIIIKILLDNLHHFENKTGDKNDGI